MKKIAYLGPKGTFTEDACIIYDVQSQKYECKTIDDVIWSVNNGTVDEGIVPIENSIEGSVNVTLDLLAKAYNVFINHEITIPISHNILSLSDSLDKIKALASHPQALAQCRSYIKKHFGDIKIITTESTAKAAKIASANRRIVAIGTKRSAEIYKLNILDSNIQDYKNNMTRFVILSKKHKEIKDRQKISIVFSTQNKPGCLYTILKIFADAGINLTKIESRPSKEILGEYIFFVDIEEHENVGRLSDVLKLVKIKTDYFRIIGIYDKINV